MIQWGFYFDQTRCIGCNACVVACKEWNEELRGDAGVNKELQWMTTGAYSLPSDYEVSTGKGPLNYAEYGKYHMKENWRRVSTTEYGSVPPHVDILNLSIACNHCAKPACAEACPVQIITKEPDFGIVLVDTARCISCGSCQAACPWSAPQFYSPNISNFREDDPLRPKMTKCTLCLDRILHGLKPACVASCTNRALDAGPLEYLKNKYREWANTTHDFNSREIEKTRPSIIFKRKQLKV